MKKNFWIFFVFCSTTNFLFAQSFLTLDQNGKKVVLYESRNNFWKYADEVKDDISQLLVCPNDYFTLNPDKTWQLKGASKGYSYITLTDKDGKEINLVFGNNKEGGMTRIWSYVTANSLIASPNITEPLVIDDFILNPDKTWQRKGVVDPKPPYPVVSQEEINSSNFINNGSECSTLYSHSKANKGKILFWQLYITNVDEEGNVYAQLSAPGATSIYTVKLEGAFSKVLKVHNAVFVKGKFVGLGKSYSSENRILRYVVLNVLALRIT